MKTCFKCGLKKPINKFSLNKKRPDGRQAQCKECHRIYRKEHYSRHKEWYIKKSKLYNSKMRTYYNTFKERPCADCRMSYPYFVMTFDHLRDKKFTISNGAGIYSKEDVLKEIEKCEVVCANCHAFRTHKRKKDKKAGLV